MSSLRGYCHVCDKEVKAEEVDDGECRCHECHECGCVERLDDAEAGTSMGGRGQEDSSSAGGAPQPDMFQNQNVLNAAMANFFTGFTGALTQQVQTRGGNVRNVDELEQLGRGILGAFQQGIQNAARNTEGVTANDRHWMEQSGAAMSSWAEQQATVLRNNAPLAAFLEQALGGNWESQRSGISEATVRQWVDEREIQAESMGPGGEAPGAEDPSSLGTSTEERESWTCPICCAGHEPGGDGLCLLCDGDGSSWHVFHKQCAFTWLCHRDSCPICRRTPVMG